MDDDDGMGRSLVRQIGIVGVLSVARILGFSSSGETPCGSSSGWCPALLSVSPSIQIRRLLLAGDVGLLAKKQPSPWMVSLFSLPPFFRW